MPTGLISLIIMCSKEKPVYLRMYSANSPNISYRWKLSLFLLLILGTPVDSSVLLRRVTVFPRIFSTTRGSSLSFNAAAV